MKGLDKYFDKEVAKKLGKEKFLKQIKGNVNAFMRLTGIEDEEQIWYGLFPDYKEPKKPKKEKE